MGILLLSYRKLSLINRKEDLNYKLMQMKQKLYEAQDYAASISDGNITMRELMNCPTSYFDRMQGYMVNSHNSAFTNADQKYRVYMPLMQDTLARLPDQAQQNAYQDMMFQQMYKQEKEKSLKSEEKAMASLDKKLQMEISKEEGKLKMIEAELNKLDEQVDKAAEKAAPKYVA